MQEFGLWGIWQDGLVDDFAVPFVQRVSAGADGVPVVTTLHTIRPDPEAYEREVLRELVHGSAAAVVMARTGAIILMEAYQAAPDRLVHVPHGVPVVKRRSRGSVKRGLGLESRTIISTLGLLDRRKGIDYAIVAMRQVVARHPEVLYLVVGETHPEVRKRQGEQYRNELGALVGQLGLADHVRFVNQYMSERELVGYLQASDIYLTPYLDRNQITSGTLAFAIGLGKAVISTPYLHATEALAEGRGLLGELFPFEMTMAHVRCAGCAAVEPVGSEMVYMDAPGMVMRCVHCERVLLTVVHGDGRYWLEMRGAMWLHISAT